MIYPKLKWIIFVVVVFLVGNVFGFLGGQVYQNYRMQQWRRTHTGPPRPQRFIADLKQQLNLTNEQATKIENILEANRKKVDAELAPFRKRADAIREEVNKEIESVLTPEQKQKYTQFRKKMEEERNKMEKERRRRWAGDSTHHFLPPPPPQPPPR